MIWDALPFLTIINTLYLSIVMHILSHQSVANDVCEHDQNVSRHTIRSLAGLMRKTLLLES